MLQELLFGIIGGLGLFLFGIHLMGEGLQKLSRDKIRTILSKFTNNRISGLLVGAGVTSLIQSSSATTVIVTTTKNKRGSSNKRSKLRRIISLYECNYSTVTNQVAVT